MSVGSQAQIPDAAAIEIHASPANSRGSRLVIASANDQEVHRDEFNTNRSEERRRFFRVLTDRLGLENGALQALDPVLVQRADAADQEVARLRAEAEQGHGDPSAPDPLADTPPEVREAATQFLHNPRMMDELQDDFVQLGVVGEEPLVLTLYIVGTSRLLRQPLGAITQSAAGSGKSYTNEIVVSLMPSERVLAATDLTPQSLYYLPQGRLQHTLVFVAERKHFDTTDDASAANATLALREMLSSGHLTKVIAVRGDLGMETVEIHQEGPIAFLQTTTQEQIFAEDESRLLPLVADESVEQTERVLAFQRQKAAGNATHPDRLTAIRDKHLAAQRMLRPLQVRIPYAEHLGVPTRRVAARRAFGHLLAFVSAVALLRQFQKQEADGWIDADVDDYSIAHRLMAPILRRVFAPLNPRARQLYEVIRARLGQYLHTPTFTRKDAEVWSGLSLTEVRNRLRVLSEAGLTDVVDGRMGVTYQYRLVAGGALEAVSLEGLPTPEELRQRIQHAQASCTDQRS